MTTTVFTSTFWHQYRLYAFILENAAVLATYVFLGLVAVPQTRFTSRRTRWGGGLFFLASSLLRLTQMAQAIFEPHRDFGSVSAEWIVILLTGAQVVSAIVFTAGAYHELVKPRLVKRIFDRRTAERRHRDWVAGIEPDRRVGDRRH